MMNLNGSLIPFSSAVPPQLSPETLQRRLQALIEDDTPPSERWTYVIFWQINDGNSISQPLLGWGDGYYKGEDDKSNTLNINRDPAEQEHRKRVLRELNSLISGGTVDQPQIDEEVTDTEWFFLISMTQSFSSGEGLPGQAHLTQSPIWVAGSDRLSSSPCNRAKQGAFFGLHTMVLIPVPDGVLELGSTASIFQSPDLMDRARVLFCSGPGSGSWIIDLNSTPPPSEQGENDPAAIWITNPNSDSMKPESGQVLSFGGDKKKNCNGEYGETSPFLIDESINKKKKRPPTWRGSYEEGPSRRDLLFISCSIIGVTFLWCVIAHLLHC